MRKHPQPAFAPCTILAALILVAFCLEFPAYAQNGFISFDVPTARNTMPKAVSETGWIGGNWSDAGGVTHGFLRKRNGQYVTIDQPGSSFTEVLDVNASGAAVGESPGFLRNAHGNVRNITIPGIESTIARSINDSGQVVGSAISDLTGHGFLWDFSGTSILIDVPGATQVTTANAINAAGEITGFFSDDSATHGYIREPDGTFIIFDAAPGTTSMTQPMAINNLGQVTGAFYDDLGVLAGFFRDTDGTITLFKSDGSTGNVGLAINDSGVIVGYANVGPGSAAFQRDADGTLEYIQIPFSNGGSVAAGITNSGHVVGNYVGTDHRLHGWAN